jgi:hypothetical protein
MYLALPLAETIATSFPAPQPPAPRIVFQAGKSPQLWSEAPIFSSVSRRLAYCTKFTSMGLFETAHHRTVFVGRTYQTSCHDGVTLKQFEIWSDE